MAPEAPVRDTTAAIIPAARASRGIPRIIHQTSASKVLPAAFQDNVDRLRLLNPGWDHRLYDDADIEEFVLSAYGSEMLAIYRSIAPAYGAARADLFRYLVIYHSGGVYLDIKSSVSRPLDDVLRPDDAFILTQWDNGPGQEHEGWGHQVHLPHLPPDGEFIQWFLASAPGHSMMHAVIEHVVGKITSYSPLRDGVGERVIEVTGPIPYTDAIMPLLDRSDYRRVRDCTMLGLRYSMADGMEHRSMMKARHYSRTRGPIIDRPRSPPMRLLIRAALEIKALRRWLLGLG